LLASINEIETNFGHNVARSSAGAIGWMQFMPSTWARWGVDANGDGIANPNDPVDAIFAAARYLRASGAPDNLARAVFAYNHAGWYVQRVISRAQVLGSLPEEALNALTNEGLAQAGGIRRTSGAHGLLVPDAPVNSIGRAMLLGNEALAHAVLEDERVSIYPCGRQDIAKGAIDRRVLIVLEYLAYSGLKPTVTALHCGHGFYTRSGNVSEHSYGDAVDIGAVNGTVITGHQGPGSITDTTIRRLLELGGALKPHQIISLMTFAGADNTLSLPDHYNHIHVGFHPAQRIAAGR
jgi:hypothetical protein